MKLVLQRVKKASVILEDGTVTGEIGAGLLVLACVEENDTEETIKMAAEKVLNIRLFNDPQTKRMHFSAKDLKAPILSVSQITLIWDGKKGNRPGWDGAPAPDVALRLFNYFCDFFRQAGCPVQTGKFGAHMDVSLVNDGPVTFSLKF
ncbi:MAG: D-tyrosyl-tRNA(Tyr) deacylase [Bdellovibrionales bacterium GWA2_49_15]|nr:MAG: D-tyrosyl-tRNA(Tyr) deacylase [Bdellovibrionales bacterium GWA2_49_15]HAZ14644.1 D-tyrosyl-tRNA(Tyr) deacylase [Bdellovibrionales bacterium]